MARRISSGFRLMSPAKHSNLRFVTPSGAFEPGNLPFGKGCDCGATGALKSAAGDDCVNRRIKGDVVPEIPAGTMFID